MDTERANLERLDRLVGLAFTVAFILAMACGFASFRHHALAVVAILVFVHLGVTLGLTNAKLERKKARDEIWLDSLTLREGVSFLAQAAATGVDLDREQVGLIWQAASEAAAGDAILGPDLRRRIAEKTTPPRWWSFPLSLVLYGAYYAGAVVIAVIVSLFI